MPTDSERITALDAWADQLIDGHGARPRAAAPRAARRQAPVYDAAGQPQAITLSQRRASGYRPCVQIVRPLHDQWSGAE
jgi:YD repeat-containing protein